MKKREHLTWKREDLLRSLPLTPLAIIKDLLCNRIGMAFILCCPQSIIQTHGAQLQANLFLLKQQISLETEQTSDEFDISRGVKGTGTCWEIIHGLA